MTDKKNNLIIAYFVNEEAAHEAADKLKEWDKDLGAIDLGAIGILTMDKKGKIKTHKVGARATGTGAKWGTVLGAVAGIFTGGIGLIGGAVAGLTAGSVTGALFHKQIGMDDDERTKLEEHLKDGGAALAVMTNDHDVVATQDKLGFLGGEVASYSVPAAAVEELEAVDNDEREVEMAAPVEVAEDEPDAVRQATLHYHRPDGDYEDWGLHVWAGCADIIDWDKPIQASGKDDFGVYFDVLLAEDADGLGYIIHKGAEKDIWDDQYFDFTDHGYEVWVVQNTPGLVDPPPTDGDTIIAT